jgi:tetratricopeptide (TPR) repeat protein
LNKSRSQKNKYYEMAAHAGLSDLHVKTENYDSALIYIQNALDLSANLEVKTDLPNLYHQTGKVYYHLNKNDSAFEYAQKSLHLASELNDTEKIGNAVELLSQISEKIGNYNSALTYFKQYKSIRDSLFNAKKVKIITEIENKYQATLKQEEINKLQSASEIQRLKLERQKQELFFKYHYTNYRWGLFTRRVYFVGYIRRYHSTCTREL